MGVPGRDRLQKIGQTSGRTPKIQSSCAVKAIGPIVVCCLELRFDAASAPGEPCGPGSSNFLVRFRQSATSLWFFVRFSKPRNLGIGLSETLTRFSNDTALTHSGFALDSCC